MFSSDYIEWIFGAMWFFIGPVAPSILATSLAYFARRKKRLFLYRTLLIPALAVSALSICVLFSLAFGDLSKDVQGGLALLFLPIWNPIIFTVLFGLSCVGYSLLRSQKDAAKEISLLKFDIAIFRISIYALIVYLLIWVMIFFKPGNSVEEDGPTEQTMSYAIG